VAYIPEASSATPWAVTLIRPSPVYANNPLSVVLRSRMAAKCGYGIKLLGGLPPTAKDIVTKRSACGTGSVRSTNASYSENMALVAPIPSARDATANAEKTGVRRASRIP
jgi:hypothetical protein